MKVSNVKFADYNGQDNLYFEVDANINEMLKSTPVYQNSRYSMRVPRMKVHYG